MGEHGLKDLAAPNPFVSGYCCDLPTDFPPLKTLESFPHNLPVQLTSFIGREREMAETKQLISNARLLTLIGPGGTGKTRLALQVAEDLLPVIYDGVRLADWHRLLMLSLIPQTIAAFLNCVNCPICR